MKTIKSKIVIVSALFVAMCMLMSCGIKKIGNPGFSWQQTEEGTYLFVEEGEQGVSYSWQGETFDKVAHGNGKLIIYKGQTIISSEDKKAYYGSFDGKGIENLNNGDKYIGKFKDETSIDEIFEVSLDLDETEISGFGVLIQDIDVYIGTFKNGKPNGSLNQYKYNNIYYSGEWKDGLFNGKGVLYKEDGSQIKGIWNEGKIY